MLSLNLLYYCPLPDFVKATLTSRWPFSELQVKDISITIDNHINGCCNCTSLCSYLVTHLTSLREMENRGLRTLFSQLLEWMPFVFSYYFSDHSSKPSSFSNLLSLKVTLPWLPISQFWLCYFRSLMVGSPPWLSIGWELMVTAVA